MPGTSYVTDRKSTENRTSARVGQFNCRHPEVIRAAPCWKNRSLLALEPSDVCTMGIFSEADLLRSVPSIETLDFGCNVYNMTDPLAGLPLQEILASPSPYSYNMFPSTNDQLVVLGELILWNLEVERRRPSPYAAGDVVVGTVAGTEPTAVVTGLANRDTTEVGADTCC